MSKTFIIAEAACTWLHGGLEAAYRSIGAAKECGADAWKTQWTSDPLEMGKRRGMDGEKYRRLAWDPVWHVLLEEECEKAGIEYMCTVFIPKDAEYINPWVKRFKVSAFEMFDTELQHACVKAGKYKKPLIVSYNPKGYPWPEGSKEYNAYQSYYWDKFWPDVCKVGQPQVLHCISKYPCPPEELGVSRCRETDEGDWLGLSDHSTSVLSGAVAVGAGAMIIEKHVRLSDTPSTDPDYGHSLCLEGPRDGISLEYGETRSEFQIYVDNIREAERML